jgi:RNA polymerase primary sigma factor
MHIVQQTEHSVEITCAQAGCESCMERLLEQHAGLVFAVIHRQYQGKVEEADLIQEGQIGLWKAIQHFDPRRGYAFSTYAWIAIRNHVWQIVMRSRKRQGWMEGEPEEDRLGEMVSAWQVEQVGEALQQEMVCLPEKQRRVVELGYGLRGEFPHSLAQIGRQMGLSRERIRQIRDEALVLLRLPGLSLHLRELCEQDSRDAYHQSLSANAAWLRSQRGQR